MSLWNQLFVEVKRGTKVTYSESDLNKLDRMYEREVSQNTERRVLSPFRKEPQRAFLAQVRDYAFEQILDRHLYTFKHLLVIPNPYGIAKQTALLLFNSSKEYKVRYRVLGDDGADFEAETEYTKRHRVMIMGLYLKRSNKIELSLIDKEGNVIKHRLIRIYVADALINQRNIVTKVEKESEVDFPMMVVNGVAFNPMVIDRNGDIRYALQLKTNKMGMIPLQNTHFLFADRTANCVNRLGQIQPCRYHEMDYLGRVYRTFILKDPISHVIAQHDSSLYLVTASDQEHINDCIIELNMECGEIVKRLDLAEILGNKYRTCEDWTMLSSMEYRDGCLLLALKRLHTVLLLHWETGAVKWVLSQPEVWDGTPLEGLVLKQEGGEWLRFGRPSSAYFAAENKLLVFSTNMKGDVSQGFSMEDYSDVASIEIQADQGTFCKRKHYHCSKTLDYGRAMLLEGSTRMIINQGSLGKKTEEKRAEITMIDKNSGNVLQNMELSRIYLSSWAFQPDVASYSQIIDSTSETVFGKLELPEPFSGEMPPLNEERIEKFYFSKPHMCDNLFLFSMRPGTIERIYFVGENHAYVQDYSMLELQNRKEIFAVQVDGFAVDEYYIYLENQGQVHKLKNEIRIVR